MYEIDDIIFHETYGFGVVKKIDNGTISVLFKGKQRSLLIGHPSIKLVNRDLVNIIVNNDISKFFDDWTIAKSGGYDNSIFNLTYGIDQIYATIYGKEKYSVSIIKHNKSLAFSCTCPVRTICKHEAALYQKVKNLFSELLEDTTIQNDNSVLKTIIKEARLSSQTLQNCQNAIDNILKNLNINTMIRVFKQIDANLYEDNYFYRSHLNSNYKEFIKYLLFNEDIRRVVNNNLYELSDMSCYKIVKSSIKYADSTKYNLNGSSDIIKYHFLNYDYRQCILSSFGYNSFFDNDFFYCVNQACEKIDPDEKLFEMVKAYITKSKNDRVYTPLLLKMPFDQLYELLLNSDNLLYYCDLKSFSKAEKIKLLPYVNKDDDDVSNILSKDLDGEISEEDKLLIISSFGKPYLTSRQKTKIVEILNKIKNTKYLREYIHNGYYENHRYWYYDDEDYCYTYSDDEKFDIDESEFFAYFNEEYEVVRSDDEIRVKCYLKKINNETIIEVVVNENKHEYYLKKNEYDDNQKSVYIRYLINHVLNKYRNDIDAQSEEIRKEIQKELDDQKSEYALNCINRLIKENTNPIKLIEKKARLEYYFDLDARGQLTLALKVGIDKFYVVKNVYRFFENFENEANEEYGKNFTLTHDIDNFIEEDKQIIKEFLKARILSENRKDIILTSSMIDEIFDKLKNKIIYYKKSPYQLRLEEKQIHFNIDKDYRIQLIDNQDAGMFITTDRNMYLVNTKDKCIDCIHATNKDIKTLRFLLENRETIIKPLLNEFKDAVFYEYRDHITIDDSIQKDFVISDINIKAYFDYEDSAIKCDSEYYIDDKKISVDSIKEKYNLTKINKYQNYLSDLGFENGVLSNDGKILNFFSMDFSELKKYCEVYLSDSIQNKKISYFTPAKIQINCESNIMQAFVSQSEYSDDELYKILAAIKKKKKFIIMQDDRILDLTGGDAQEFEQTVEELGLDSKKLSESTQLPIAKALKAIAHQNSCNIDDYLLNMINDISNFKNADIKLPKINADLRDYQKYGYNWLSILSKYHIGGILADDMGLGKTLEMITLISSDNRKQPNLIVCPKSVVFNWVNEFNKFSPEEKVIEIYGLKKQREEIIKSIKQKEKVTYIVSYDSLRIDIDLYKTTFNYVVLDEAQYIKNVNAQKTCNVKKVKAEHRFALTGTPIENNIIDLWSVFDFIIPGYFEGVDEFRNRYNSDDNFTHIISKRVAPFILRRNKKDVLKDLPDKYEHILTAEMSEPQRKVYDAYVMQANNKINEGLGAFEILPYLMRLRQICIDPKIFIDNYEGDSGKMNMLKQIIVDYTNDNRRIMIVSQFVQALNEIEEMLKKLQIPYFIITGSVDAKKRIEICDQFNNNSKEKIVLVSLKAGGTGLNLIGADTVIHLDPWWNVAASDQATDRTYRIGQKRNVEVIKLICERSIEQRVVELQNIKKDLIDKVISDNDSSVTNASIDDIKFILG